MQILKIYKEFERSCGPTEQVWTFPVMIVVLTLSDSIGSVLKHDFVGGYIWSGNYGNQSSEMDCYALMETNGEGIVKSYLQLFITISWKRL